MKLNCRDAIEWMRVRKKDGGSEIRASECRGWREGLVEGRVKEKEYCSAR